MENNDNKNLTQKTISGIIWKLAERIGAQLVTLLVTIILARILLPEDYGIVSIVTIVITILNVFVTNGLGSSLIQKVTSDQLDFSTVFYAGIVLSMILYGILFVISKPIADFYGNEQITWVLRIMGLRLPLAAVNSVQQAYVSKKMIFRKFFFATLIGTVISGVVGIVMAYKGYGVWSLVAQYLTNVTIDTIVLFIIVKWRPSLRFSFKRLKSLFSYGWKLLVSGLLDTGYNELRSLVIGKKYSSTDLAYYDKGNQFPSLLATNVNSSISSVLFSAMSKIQDNKDKVKEATRKSIRICSYLIFPCMVGLACIAEPFVKVILTNKWLPIVPYLQIMCFFYAFWPVHTANLSALKAIGRSDLYLVLEIAKKLIGIIVLAVTMWFGVFWIAIGMAFTTITFCFINAFPNRRLLNYTYKEQILDLLPNMLIGVIMGVCVYLLNYLHMNLYILFILQISTGIVIYLFLSIITKNYSYYYLYGYIKKLKKIIYDKKYSKNTYIDKHRAELINANIDIDKIDKYCIIYDNKNKNKIIIGERNDTEFLLRYIHFDAKKHNREYIDIMFNIIFLQYDINIIKFECDKKSTDFLHKYGYNDSIIRFKSY